MPSKGKNQPHPQWTEEEGEALENLARPIAEILGSNYAGMLRGKARTATYGDLLEYNGWGIDGGERIPIPDTILNEDEISSIISAIQSKTGRSYYSGYMGKSGGNPPPACTTCVP